MRNFAHLARTSTRLAVICVDVVALRSVAGCGGAPHHDAATPAAASPAVAVAEPARPAPVSAPATDVGAATDEPKRVETQNGAETSSEDAGVPESTSGLGGGGRGEGIGLGFGTLGHGMGSGYGTGRGSFRTAKGTQTRVLSGAPTASPGLEREVVRRVVRWNIDGFRACYEAGLASNPNLKGRVTLRFTIGKDGKVTSMTDGGSDLPDANVVRCVLDHGATLVFPAPRGGSPVQVTYPIDFKPA